MADSDVSSLAHVDIILERSLGNILRGILYGVEIFTFFAAVYCICHRSSNYRKRQSSYIAFGGVLIALVTISVMSNGLWGQYIWIEHRNYPGGQLRFYNASEGAWYNVLGFAADATTNILTDGLLVYRCHIIWGSRWYILALPMLIYLASSVLALVDVLVQALPHSSWLHGTQDHLAVLWVSLSVSLNVTVTSVICFRLLRMRTLAREVLTPETSKMCASIAAMLIESAAPFTILGTIVVIIGAQRKPLTWGFADIWAMFCSLSPRMIILRVAMGRGWLKETVNEINTTLAFANPPMVQGQSQGVRTTIHNTEGSMLGPGTPENNSDMSIKSA